MLYHINDTVNTLLTHHQTCDTIFYNMSGFVKSDMAQDYICY